MIENGDLIMPHPHKTMSCPVCDVPLTMSERQGIEIDYCPQCRGIWLDRGELDKLIERSAKEFAPQPASQAAPAPTAQSVPPYPQQQAYPPQGYQQPYYGKPYKRKSFLEELFD